MKATALTAHAKQRISQRSISPEEVQLIRDYGETYDVGHGARGFALSRKSIRELREDFSELSKRRLERLRRAYLIGTEDVIVTVAFSNRPFIN